MASPTKYYYLKPVSTLTFALVQTDVTGTTVIHEATPENLDQLNYNGLYKFLLLVHKMDPLKLGMISSEVRSLPLIDLAAGMTISEDFKKRNSLTSLREKLKTFLDRWFRLSIESQQKTSVNPSVDAVLWPNKNTVTPQLPTYIKQGNEGATIVSFEDDYKQRTTIQELINDVESLKQSIVDCQNNTDPTACGKAQNTAAKIEQNIKKLKS